MLSFCLPVWHPWEGPAWSLQGTLDCGILHVWLAFACSNGVPLKFYLVTICGLVAGSTILPVCQAEYGL